MNAPRGNSTGADRGNGEETEHLCSLGSLLLKSGPDATAHRSQNRSIMNSPKALLIVPLVSFSLLSSPLQARDAVKAGRFHVEHPTLLNLGFEWSIEGDD